MIWNKKKICYLKITSFTMRYQAKKRPSLFTGPEFWNNGCLAQD